MTISSDLIEKKKQLEQKLSEKLISQEIGAIHRIYLDLSIIQEIYIGALLLLAKNEKEYQSILACITIYLSRLDNRICNYFTLSRTDKDVFNILNDKQNAYLLFKSSPFTNVWYTLQDIFIKIIEKNRVLDYQTNTKLEICLNTYPILYPDNICKWFNNVLVSLYKNISFSVISKSFEKCSHEFRTSFDLYFLHDITPIVSTDSDIFNDFYLGEYESKILFSRRVISTKNTSIDIIKGLKQTKDFLNVFTTFSFLDVYIPGIKYNPPVIEEDTIEVGKEHVIPN